MCRDFLDRYTLCGHVQIEIQMCRNVPNCYQSPITRQDINGYCNRCIPAGRANEQQVRTPEAIERPEQVSLQEESRLARIPPQDLTQREARGIIQAYIPLVRLHATQEVAVTAITQRLRTLQIAVALIPDALLDDIPGVEKAAQIAALRASLFELAERNPQNQSYSTMIAALNIRYADFIQNMAQYDQERNTRNNLLRQRDRIVAISRRMHRRDSILGAARDVAINDLLIPVPINPQSCHCGICSVEYGMSPEDGHSVEPELPIEMPCPGRHVFGRRCLFLWLREIPTCPICRYDLNIDIGMAVIKNAVDSVELYRSEQVAINEEEIAEEARGILQGMEEDEGVD